MEANRDATVFKATGLKVEVEAPRNAELAVLEIALKEVLAQLKIFEGLIKYQLILTDLLNILR